MIDSEIIQQQTKLKILLIGDSCIDKYQIGTVDRLSPEAPVPVIKLVEEYSIPGMAANVQANLNNFNLEIDFITNEHNIVKTRYIDKRSGQHLLRVDNEPTITPWSGQTPLPIKDYDAVVISDYNKGFLTYEHIEKIIADTTNPVFIDTKKQDLSRFSSDHVYIKINELEYRNRQSIPKKLIVTLGDKGAVYQTTDPKIEKIFEIKPCEVVDVCGCGDTFLSALAYQYLQTNSIEDAILFANTAAGITVRHQGNYAPSLEEIKNGY